MSPIVLEKKKYTYQDYLETPDDERYELIEGELIIMSPSPVTKHQRVSGNLEFEIRKFVKESNLGEVFDAPYDIHLDDYNVVQPDILFISNDRLNIIGEKNTQGAPDLTIEIISESSTHKDMVKKKRLYEKFGVKEYWIVFPDEEIIEIHILKNNAYQPYKTYAKEDTLNSLLLKGLKIDLKKIFC